MSDEDLCYMTASEAVSLFKARKLSPVELMQAVIDRAEAVEPTINVFADTRSEDTRLNSSHPSRSRMPSSA